MTANTLKITCPKGKKENAIPLRVAAAPCLNDSAKVRCSACSLGYLVSYWRLVASSMPGASWGNQNRTVAAVLVCKMFGAAVIAGAAAGTHGAIHADEPSESARTSSSAA